MSDEVRINRAPQAPVMQAGQTEYSSGSKSSKLPWLILGLVVVVLIVVGVLFRDKLFSKGSKDSGKMENQVPGKKSDYQAVFLTNGQVYFGKVSAMEKDFMTVKDIYYLQVVQQPPLQGSTQDAASGQAAAQPQISLVKLGNELHGPVDEMHISRAQILFYEDLKEDGQVVKAIRSYQTNPSGAPAN